MRRPVVFTPEAQTQLVDLYRYLAAAASPETAARFTDSIVAFCEDLAVVPRRGRTREDIRPGLRVVGFKRRAVIAFAETETSVMIIGVFYGGRDYESMLAEPDE